VKILGIDPGLATTGIGFVQTKKDSMEVKKCDWFTITTKAHTPLSERLFEIQEDLGAYIDEIRPELAVVEKLFFARNERTAIDVAQARGVMLFTLADAGIPIIEPTPLQLKSCITGDGRADKKQVQTMLMRMLNLQSPPKPDDAADALGLALYGALQQAKVGMQHA